MTPQKCGKFSHIQAILQEKELIYHLLIYFLLRTFMQPLTNFTLHPQQICCMISLLPPQDPSLHFKSVQTTDTEVSKYFMEVASKSSRETPDGIKLRFIDPASD